MLNKRAKAMNNISKIRYNSSIDEGEGRNTADPGKMSRETEQTPDMQRPSFNELMRTSQEFKVSSDTKKQFQNQLGLHNSPYQ